MKGHKWLISAIAIILVKHTIASKSRPKSKPAKGRPLPLTKSFGIARSGKNLEDQRLGQEYIEQYQEMLKASQESFEIYDEQNEKRFLRKVIGDDEFGLMADAEAGGMPPNRRSAQRFQSVAGKRRARSQAVRRHKLTNQGKKSHIQHSKHIDEYTDQDITDLLNLY